MSAGTLPTLVVAHGRRSIPALQIAQAAEGICDIVWLIREHDSEVEVTGRLLRRFGQVIEVGGLDLDEAAERLGATGAQGIVAFRDSDLALVANIASMLDLSFHTRQTALCLVDKVAQRRRLARCGVVVPAFAGLEPFASEDELVAIESRLGYPCVLKPRRGSGSRNTFVVADPDSLRSHLRHLGRVTADTEPMILEQYLASWSGAEQEPFADYVSVESLWTGASLEHVAVTGRTQQAHPLRETGFFIPGRLGAEHDAVLACASAALEALGVQSGCTHTEVKLTP
ncbi:MAG: ATP-grasp domain-containing protein, partial [Acidimicrobiales bacterium]